MEFKNILKEIGLTEGETKVYLSLLKLGSSTTGPLAKQAEVSSSKVYKILDRLEKKGLVGHVTKGKTHYYTAMEPKRILDYLTEKEFQINQKKELIQKIIPQFEFQQKMVSTDAILYVGFKAVTNSISSIIDELKPGQTYYVIGAGYGDVPGLRPFFHKHHQRRATKGVRLKMLANYDTKYNLEKTTFLKANIRFLPRYLASNMEIFFYQQKVFITIWTREPLGVLIGNPEAVRGFEMYFKTLWKMGRA